MALKFMYITNSPEIADIAQKNGVDRIWIDLEVLGKEERQKNLDTVKSQHTINDIVRVKARLTTAELLVRVNPWNSDSEREINEVINAGADIIMLPYWKSVEEVKGFINAVSNRCKKTLLLETKEAVDRIDDVLDLGGFDEIHIGLNDLHLSFGLDFMFELLTDGTVEKLCKKFSKKGVPYGFGGIAKIGEGAVAAERIILEHYRLGSTRAILSRSFCDCSKIGSIEEFTSRFEINMEELRSYEQYVMGATEADFQKNREELCDAINAVVASIRMQKGE